MKAWLLGLAFILASCAVTEQEAVTKTQPEVIIPPEKRTIPVPGGEQAKVHWMENTVLLTDNGGAGSGFFVHSQYMNFVVTARHVAANLTEQEAKVTTYDNQKYTVTNTLDSKITDASIVYLNDVAKVDGLNVECRTPEFQETVYVVGHPYGIDQEVITEGKIASPKRIAHPAIPGIIGVLLDVRVSPGNSGSPVLDSDGDVIGILVAAVPSGGVGIMVPINDVCDELGLN